MSTNCCLIVGQIETFIVRKKIKNLHLSVLPPLGRVRVTAPLHIKDEAIRVLLATRLPWIKKQKSRFQNQRRETVRKYESGESHYFLGKRYKLEVVNSNEIPKVRLRGKKIILNTGLKSSIVKREQIMREWHRTELRVLAKQIIEKWEKRMSVKTTSWGIKRMKTRWGTCCNGLGRIWLNLELAKKPIECIEYVVVHELAHLIERTHNRNFIRVMNTHLPNWLHTKQVLNNFILAHEYWPDCKCKAAILSPHSSRAS